MLKIFCLFPILLLSISFLACKSAKSTLNVSTLRNYDTTAADHILFLDFELTKSNDTEIEKVRLINSIAGNGRMKNLQAHTSGPSQIRVIQYFVNGKSPIETDYENPLTRSTEIPDPSGKIEKRITTGKKALLSIRIQEDKALDKMELVKIAPDKKPLIIYTLQLKNQP